MFAREDPMVVGPRNASHGALQISSAILDCDNMYL
jgi:hypothetical protein